MVQKFVTNMRDKVKSMRKEEEGFSLVELIVVIVILAILIGVTIGGVYKYVNQSRVNTDVNNAATIQSTVSTLAVDKDIYTWASKSTSKDAVVTWTSAGAVTSGTWKNDAEVRAAVAAAEGVQAQPAQKISDKVSAILTDGLPASKTGATFVLVFDTDNAGNVKITCKAYSTAPTVNDDGVVSGGTVLEGQE